MEGEIPYKLAPAELLHPRVKIYFQRRDVQSIRLWKDPNTGWTKMHWKDLRGITHLVGGVHRYIKRMHVPRELHKYKRPPNIKNRVNLPSSKAKGKAVDRAFDLWVENGGKMPTQKISKMGKAAIEFCMKRKWVPQASQVPAYLRIPDAVTLGDVLVKDKKDRLILLEIKTGSPYNPQGYMTKNLIKGERVPFTRQVAWHLQILYTRLGVESQGMQIDMHYVLQIHEIRNCDVPNVNLLCPPRWVYKFRNRAIDLITGSEVAQVWTIQENDFMQSILDEEKKKKKKTGNTKPRKKVSWLMSRETRMKHKAEALSKNSKAALAKRKKKKKKRKRTPSQKRVATPLTRKKKRRIIIVE